MVSAYVVLLGHHMKNAVYTGEDESKLETIGSRRDNTKCHSFEFDREG